MKVLIPLAGQGTRLLPYTENRQKALLPVCDKPVLDQVLHPFLEAGIRDISLVIGHLGDQIKDYMTKYSDLRIRYITQPQQRGLGEAVFLGLENESEPMVIILSDTILEMDFGGFIHEEGNLLGVMEVDDPRRFGVVETEGRQILSMVEKPVKPISNLAISGIYRIEQPSKLRESLKSMMTSAIKTKGEFQLTDALNHMLEVGDEFRTFPIDRWLDCGTKESLLATNCYLLQKIGGEFVHPDATVVNSTLHSSSVMERCHISNCTLDNSIVLPGTRLENRHIRDEIIEAGE
jgi:glucose-1-phosphate thymidylyltransferase